MSVFLAEVTGLGADAGENSMAASDDSQDDGLHHSGVKLAGAHRDAISTQSPLSPSQPPPSYRQADDHVQLAMAESTHAEANLGLLVRGLQHLLAGAGAARDAHASLSRELGVLRDLLSQGNEAEQAAMARLRDAEETLDAVRRDALRERARFIEEEDRFLEELIDDHQREVAALRARLNEALERSNPAVAIAALPEDATVERLGSAATLPSLPAQTGTPPASEVPVAWATPDPGFALSDWAPHPPFSLAEFAEEKKSDDFERELASARDSGRPTPVESTENSALIHRTTGRVIDPEETPLPTWQAISTLESLRAPELPPEEEAEEEEALPVATSQKRATLPAMPPPPAPAAAPSPGDPPSSQSRSGHVIATIKPKSVKIPRHAPPPSLLDQDEPEPLTVRPKTPLPEGVAAERALAEENAPHLVDTVRPPPIIKPKPDLSQRPLREYSLGKSEVAEERLDGKRSPDSDPEQ
jgi:hypothetical protein